MEWQETAEAKYLMLEAKGYEVDRKLSLKQVERMTKSRIDERSQIKTNVFVKLFTTSKMGLGILGTGAGTRERDDQQRFRQRLVKSYAAGYSDSKKSDQFLWCPVLKKYLPSEFAVAAHLFSWAHGQDTLNAIFGPSLEDELFSPLNGMIVSKQFEKIWDKGFLAIVPDVKDDATDQELESWEKSNPKEYKVRILDPDNKIGKFQIEPSAPGEPKGKTWNDLDGSRLKFLNNFRPRARYLYFHFCCQLLRAAWSDAYTPSKVGRRILQQSGTRFWGTRGRYISRNEIRGFIEQIGHEWQFLEEHGIDDDPSDEPQNTFIQTATNQILDEVTGRKSEWEKQDEEDEDEDEEF